MKIRAVKYMGRVEIWAMPDGDPAYPDPDEQALTLGAGQDLDHAIPAAVTALALTMNAVLTLKPEDVEGA